LSNSKCVFNRPLYLDTLTNTTILPSPYYTRNGIGHEKLF